MSDETMVQRFERFVVDQCAKKGALYAAAPVSQLAADFADSEVRRALAPRSPSQNQAIDILKAGLERHRQPDGKMCSCGGCTAMHDAIAALKDQPAPAQDRATRAEPPTYWQALRWAAVRASQFGDRMFGADEARPFYQLEKEILGMIGKPARDFETCRNAITTAAERGEEPGET